MSSDIPKGWKYEIVPPPAYHKMPPSEQYRKNWERIFGAKDERNCEHANLKSVSNLTVCEDCGYSRVILGEEDCD